MHGQRRPVTGCGDSSQWVSDFLPGPGWLLTVFRCLIIALVSVPSVSVASQWIESAEQRELNAARAAWAQHKLSDYAFTLESGGVFGSMKYRVTVENGRCKKVTYWVRLRRHKASCHKRTVPALFDELDRVIKAQPISLTVRFDATYGFPTEVVVEPASNLTDQSWWYSVSCFRAK